jgi:RNA polymerase sigma-70 factor (ECF subfamily)
MENIPNDIDLHQRILNGEKSSFKDLFEKYYPDLVRFVYLYVQDRDSAEDIVQEFFVQFWIKRQEKNISKSVKSYLYRSVRNKALNYLRDKKNDIPINSEANLFSSSASKEDDIYFDYEIIRREVKSAIESLPEKCKQIFNLSRNDNLTYKEIAEELNISTKTVESQMSIALNKLRKSLKPILTDIFFLLILISKKM